MNDKKNMELLSNVNKHLIPLNALLRDAYTDGIKVSLSVKENCPVGGAAPRIIFCGFNTHNNLDGCMMPYCRFCSRDQ